MWERERVCVRELHGWDISCYRWISNFNPVLPMLCVCVCLCEIEREGVGEWVGGRGCLCNIERWGGGSVRGRGRVREERENGCSNNYLMCKPVGRK